MRLEAQRKDKGQGQRGWKMRFCVRLLSFVNGETHLEGAKLSCPVAFTICLARLFASLYYLPRTTICLALPFVSH
eukprot:13369-Pleurochrysis_carterae.AAC.2